MNTYETFTIRSSISPQLMKSTLIKGFLIGLIGIICLLIGSLYLPVKQLQFWGFPLFILGMGLIIIGLLPYRRLTRLETKPSTLTALGLEELEFSSGGKRRLSWPISAISSMEYLTFKNRYGMVIRLKDVDDTRVVMYDPSFKIDKIGKYDFFLPYFSRRGVEELKTWINNSSEEKI